MAKVEVFAGDLGDREVAEVMYGNLVPTREPVRPRDVDEISLGVPRACADLAGRALEAWDGDQGLVTELRSAHAGSDGPDGGYTFRYHD